MSHLGIESTSKPRTLRVGDATIPGNKSVLLEETRTREGGRAVRRFGGVEGRQREAIAPGFEADVFGELG